MAYTHFFTFFHYYLLVVTLLVGSLFQQVYLCSQLPPTLFSWSGKAKWIKTVGVYSMGFKVPTHGEEIGDPLDRYSVNCVISPN